VKLFSKAVWWIAAIACYMFFLLTLIGGWVTKINNYIHFKIIDISIPDILLLIIFIGLNYLIASYVKNLVMKTG
jgi:site-specific recombinase